MYAYIKGTVEYLDSDGLILENNGIGFKILTSSNLAGRLSMHEDATIYTYLHVREDNMSLFGFLSKDEINVFKLLIAVSGIGPKVGLAIMSALTVDEIRIAVLSDDHKAIAKANGVGPKTAQRVIIELKDKFKLDDVFEGLQDDDGLQYIQANDTISETAMALSSLGYSNIDALRAIKKIKDSDKLSVEELLKAALKVIM